MLAQLVDLTDGSTILLDKPVLLLGRHPECDVQIDSRKVSRRHCIIALVSDYLVVRDLGSTNGIRVNGIRVNEGRLKSGDELTVGNYRYQLRWGVLETPARPPGRAAVPQPTPIKSSPPASSRRPQTSMEDDLLEACDEPVPLDEPGSLPPVDPLEWSELPEPKPAVEKPPEPVPSPPPSSVIVPDHLDLAPVSDILPSPPPPPPT